MKKGSLAVWRRLDALPRAAIRRLSHEAAWVGLGQVLAVLGGLVGVRLLTSLLDPASYGEVALAMTIAALSQQVLIGPLASAFLRFYSAAEEAGELSAYGDGVRRLLLAATGAGLALLVASATVAALAGRTSWLGLLLAAFVFAAISGYSGAADAIQSAARQRAVVALHQGTAQWLRVLGAAALISLWHPSSSVALWGFALGSAIVLWSQLLFLRRARASANPTDAPASREAVRRWTGQLWNYAAPFGTWGLFTWAQAASDRWALNWSASASLVGSYAVLFQLGYYPVVLLMASMVQLLSPILFQRAGDASDARRMATVRSLSRGLLLASLALTAAGTLLALALHRLVFTLLVSSEYRSISELLPFMVLSGGLFASGQVAALSPLSRPRSSGLLAPKIGTAILGVGLNLLGAFVLGIRGVVWAGVVFSASYLLWILWLDRRPCANS